MKTCAIIVIQILLLGCELTRADVITDWNSTALNAIRIEKSSPPVASRALAILHIAMCDAVNGITRKYQPYLVSGPVPSSASLEAAAATAGHSVMVALFPNQRTNFDAVYYRSLLAIPNRPQ